MKLIKLLLSTMLVLLASTSHSSVITIIESQSANPGHNMDDRWLNVATTMGHSASINNYSLLSNQDYYDSTDMLIISSGVINLSAEVQSNIQQYVAQGGAVYLQGEYSGSYNTNTTFENIVESLGGNFTWTGTVSGMLEPMAVKGNFSNTPNSVSYINEFWYGYAGYGDSTVESFLEFEGEDFGFSFQGLAPENGTIITTTDQDWIRVNSSTELMENIIFQAMNGEAVPEPALLLLLSFGLLGLGISRKRK